MKKICQRLLDSNVDYATYTITKEAVDRDITDPLLSQAMKLEVDDKGTQDAKLTINGYFEADDVYYQVAIGAEAFKQNETLTTLILEDGVSEIGRSSFFECTSLACDLDIPGSVKIIGASSFMRAKLTGLKLNEGITEIGYNAFRDISTLKVDICLPASMENFGYDIFMYSAITDFTVAEDSEYYCMVDGNLYSKDKKTLVWYCSKTGVVDFEIPEGVETLARSAFRAVNLKTVTIPKSVTLIESFAFMDDTGLEKINYKGTSTEWDSVARQKQWDTYMGNSVSGGTKIIYDYTPSAGENE